MKTYAFIDASNIIYGTRDDGWKVDFKKLYKYLVERYGCEVIYYFAGEYEGSPKQKSLYRMLEELGYSLMLKPVKMYRQPNGSFVRKANCDVDLTLTAMRDKDRFTHIILMSGDGDFEALIRFFIEVKKRVTVIGHGKNTAKEIKKLMGEKFIDLRSLRGIVEYKKR